MTILHTCGANDQTHSLAEYANVLSSIRQMPDCAPRSSVVECAGYFPYEPYTEFLQRLERNMKCSGFCLPIRSSAPSSVSPPVNTTSRLLQLRKRVHTHGRVERQLVNVKMAADLHTHTKKSYLSEGNSTALFSSDQNEAFCAGIAAQDIKNLVGSIGKQTFFHGMALLVISIIMSFQRLVSACTLKAQPVEYQAQ